MTSNLYMWTLVAISVALVIPASAEACVCGPVAISQAFNGASAVFKGKVTSVRELNPPRVRANGGIPFEGGFGPDIMTFSTEEVFKGFLQDQVDVNGGSGDCRSLFEVNQSYLVYADANETDGTLVSTNCSRTRLLDEAEEDLKYLEGTKLGQEQAILYGLVLRAGTDETGAPVSQAPFRTFDLILESETGQRRVTTGSDGEYQIVVPPGRYTTWVELRGRTVTAPRTLTLNKNDTTWLILPANFGQLEVETPPTVTPVEVEDARAAFLLECRNTTGEFLRPVRRPDMRRIDGQSPTVGGYMGVGPPPPLIPPGQTWSELVVFHDAAASDTLVARSPSMGAILRSDNAVALSSGRHTVRFECGGSWSDETEFFW